MKISLATILHSSSIQSPSCYISFMVGIKYSLFLKTFSLMIINFALKFRKLKPILSGHLRLTWILKWTDGIVEMLCFDILIYPECQNMRINGWYSKLSLTFSLTLNIFIWQVKNEWLLSDQKYVTLLKLLHCKAVLAKMYQHFHKILNGQA